MDHFSSKGGESAIKRSRPTYPPFARLCQPSAGDMAKCTCLMTSGPNNDRGALQAGYFWGWVRVLHASVPGARLGLCLKGLYVERLG
jgi:hypothetical protein